MIYLSTGLLLSAVEGQLCFRQTRECLADVPASLSDGAIPVEHIDRQGLVIAEWSVNSLVKHVPGLTSSVATV